MTERWYTPGASGMPGGVLWPSGVPTARRSTDSNSAKVASSGCMQGSPDGCKVRRGSSRADCLASCVCHPGTYGSAVCGHLVHWRPWLQSAGRRCFRAKCTPARLQSTPVHLESQLLSALVSFVCGTLLSQRGYHGIVEQAGYMEPPFVPARLGLKASRFRYVTTRRSTQKTPGQ